MNNSWITRLHQELLRLRKSGPGWGNRPGGMPYVEPTALAALALCASDPVEGAEQSRAAAVAATDWLAGLQHRDGSLGIAPDLPQPRWTTPLGILVWSATGRAGESRRKAVDWLLSERGTTWDLTAAEAFGHDTRIAGWPWVEGTHSWLEPTAMAVLALRREGYESHTRTRDGESLIRDRAIRGGGWNYGNSTVFGADLRPQPAPTGLALIALFGVEDGDAPVVERGCAYLERILPSTRAPQSLGLGILALAAWDRRPREADEWLIDAHAKAARRSNSIAQLAYLLLAAGSRTLKLLGVNESPRRENAEP